MGGGPVITIANAGSRAPAVSERLAEHVVATRFKDLPPAVVERTKDLLVHQLALVFAGHFSDDGKRAVALAHELSAGAGDSTIVGDRRPATLLDAIFANTVLGTGPLDDFQLPSGLHLGRLAHPVAWVIGERERSSGQELITAVVVGYDAACKLADPQFIRAYQRRPQHAFTPFAATAIASRLLRHDRAHAARAIAHAAHLGMGIVEGGEGPANSALVARNAVMAALMARADDRGSLRTIEGTHGFYSAFFGGPPADLERNLAGLGREFSIMGASTKRYPSSASHIVPLELTRELVERSGVRADRVDSLSVTLSDDFSGRFGYMEAGIERPDPSAAEVLRSLRVKLALLLLDGAIVPEPTLAHFGNRAVQATLPKVTLRYEPRPLDYARIEIATTDGKTLSSEGGLTPYPKGDWSAWLRKDGERLLSETRLRRLEQLMTDLEDVDDVADVMASTVPDRGA